MPWTFSGSEGCVHLGEIEAQLRILFIDELPAIIHRLSLQLWDPEYRAEARTNGIESNVEETLSDSSGSFRKTRVIPFCSEKTNIRP
jgi:hypothetical protein